MVQADIIKQLSLKNVEIITDSFLRPRLSYLVQKVPVKLHTIRNLLAQVTGSVIIYCNTRNNVSQLASLLKAYGYAIGEYHAGMTISNRQAIQNSWMQDQIQIVVCTSAFGMGINKPNVRLVIHYEIPGSIEQYYQEAGRAGRDGLSAKAILLYQQNDWDYWESVQVKKYPPIETIKKVYQDLADYVQLPIGMGEKQQFLFDFETFCTSFKLDKMIARNALQWIAQEGHVQFSDSSFKPSLVQVIENREGIELFEKNNAILGIVLQTILRTYGGIIDSPQYINESILAQLLNRDFSFVQTQLQLLKEYGIISYEQKEHQPVVQFQWNRASASFMKLDFDNYQLRKKSFLDRIGYFTTYLKSSSIQCRSVFLAQYFGEKHPSPCGICDLCTSTKD